MTFIEHTARGIQTALGMTTETDEEKAARRLPATGGGVMSKASEWAERRHDEMPKPKFVHFRTVSGDPFAQLAVIDNARVGVLINGCCVEVFQALALARWLIDTFGEEDAKA